MKDIWMWLRGKAKVRWPKAEPGWWIAPVMGLGVLAALESTGYTIGWTEAAWIVVVGAVVATLVRMSWVSMRAAKARDEDRKKRFEQQWAKTEAKHYEASVRLRESIARLESKHVRDLTADEFEAAHARTCPYCKP